MSVCYSTIPPEELASLLADHPVASSDLEIIRDPRNPSRYLGVYERRRASIRYRARVLKFIELGCQFRTAAEAARAVVAWYKRQYGDRWIKVFANRNKCVYRVSEVWKRVVWSGRPDQLDCIGWRVDVFVRGAPVGISHEEGDYRNPNARFIRHYDPETRHLFPSRKQAAAAAKRAIVRITERRKVALPPLLMWRA